MKIGIYISGLGQSFTAESVEKYAGRLMNEMRFNSTEVKYELKTEKVSYSENRESSVVSIIEKNGKEQRVVYKIYDFKYHEILTERFKSYSLILKNLCLFLLVIQKFPLMIKRLFLPASYSRPFQTLYLFVIFMVIAGAILFMLPGVLNVVIDNTPDKLGIKASIFDFMEIYGIHDIPYITKAGITKFSSFIIPITTLLLLIVPNANTLLANLATEFVCANDYMQYGTQRQLLQGNIERLVNYISEDSQNNDGDDCQIHFHTYSFGSILALDYIYPYCDTITANAEKFCKAIITIGTPFEFIKSYYPSFYQNRIIGLGNKLCWINIYSIADALATNFRYDAKRGDAQFGLDQKSKKPININYEVAPLNTGGVINFLMLYSIKAHGVYWDPKTEGQSCLGLIYDEMKKEKLL